MKLLSRHSKRFVPWINLSYVDFHPHQKPGSAIQVCVHQFSARWLLSSPLLFFCLYFVWRPSQTCLWIIIWTNYTSSSLEFWDIFGMFIFTRDISHFHALQILSGALLRPASGLSFEQIWVTRLRAVQATKKGHKSQVYLGLFVSSSKIQMGYLIWQTTDPPKNPWLLSS